VNERPNDRRVSPPAPAPGRSEPHNRSPGPAGCTGNVPFVAVGPPIKASVALSRPKRAWPAPLGSAAYHGPVGEFVRAVEPHTEGDPAAIVIQTLACLGNAMGRNPHFFVEDTRHGTNIDVAVVGDTATARKGTSFNRGWRLAELADAEWAARNEGSGGLTTAEGLIAAVGDHRTDQDKRLLAVMSEFGEVLVKMKREGNALSATLRNAWDGQTLRIRTRQNPISATGAHVSVVGHITAHDLANLLESTDIFNGFGNRFLWVSARRARELPLGGPPGLVDDLPLVNDVKLAIAWAQETPRVIGFSSSAESLWIKLYSELGRREDGRVGAITDRAEAQVRRLALIYAVLDRSRHVQLEHLRAALEVWRYCEDSAAYLFSDEPATSMERRIERQLQRREGWVRRTTLTRALKDPKTYQFDRALEALRDVGKLEERTVATGGRPRREYRLSNT
jgi:Protein of unknown function (DUF3987)